MGKVIRTIDGWEFKVTPVDIYCCECLAELKAGAHIWEKIGKVSAFVLCNKCFDEGGDIPKAIDEEGGKPGSLESIVANAKWEL